MVGLDRLARFVDDLWKDAWQRTRARARFRGSDPRQRTHHDATGFGLPPRIHNRTSLVPNLPVVPDPRFGIDPFPDAAKQTQARQIVLLDVFITPFDEGSNRGRSGVKNADLVLFDQLPEAVFGRMIGSPFIHQAGGPSG